MSDRPSVAELQEAMKKAKSDGLNSSELKHTDRGAGRMKFHLASVNSKYHSLSLDDIRVWSENLSKSGGEPGNKKRNPIVVADKALSRFVQAFPPPATMPAAWHEIHDSGEWRELVYALKRSLDFTCQGCGQVKLGGNLEGHVVDYKQWRRPGFVLILCVDCHKVCDALRRRGNKATAVEVPFDLFPDEDTQ